jgi:hypothetical protein
MNKNIMKKWTKALKSGKYRKTTGALCKISKQGNASYCCLGVLTDLFNKEHTPDKQRQLIGCGVLSSSVMKWAGIKSATGMLDYNSKETSLTDLNDCKKGKRSFKRMADIIEKNWEQL